MSWLTTNAGAMITLWAIMCAVMAWRLWCSARSRRRVRDLEIAQRVLASHMDALQFVLENPKAPLKLKSDMLSFSELVIDHETAHDLVSKAIDALEAGSRPNDDFDREVERTWKISPDLGRAMDHIVSTGVQFMLYRWEDTSDKFNLLLSRTVADSKREAAIFAAAKRRSKSGSNHDMPDGGAIYVPA